MHVETPPTQPQDSKHEIERILTTAFPAAWLLQTARETGAVKRVRDIDIAAFFWTIVLGFGVNAMRSIASLHRKYEADAGKVAYSSFYERFTPDLVRFLRACVHHGLEHVSKTAPRTLKDAFAKFQDIVVQDSCVLRLHESLAKKWPATRSRKAAAGVKLSAVLSVVANSAKAVRLFGERMSEVKTLRIGAWVKDRVLLIDLGFFKYGVFDRIQRNGGYFVSRLKDNANPTVTKLLREVRGRSVPVVGERLRDVLPRLHREVLDVEVEVQFQRRAYKGKSRKNTGTFRVVAVLNHETGEYHVYITNIPPEMLTAENVAELYRMRWEVELLFKELQSSYALDELDTKNPHAVEALIWSAVLTLIASRLIHRAAAARAGEEHYARFTNVRWGRIFRENAPGILSDVLRYEGVSSDTLSRVDFMAMVGMDPNVNRDRLLDSVRG